MTPYYDDGIVTLYHGDCREILPTITGVDAVLTDPPYGINLPYDGHRDDWRPGVEVWEMVAATGASHLHFTSSNKHIPHWLDVVAAAGWEYLHTSVYWNKGRAGGNGNGQFAYAWEPLLSFTRGEPLRLVDRMMSDVLAYSHPHQVHATDHPAERHLPTWRAFLRLLPGDVVLDPFVGSGTTLRAAKDLGRRAIGIEQSERYCALTAERLGQEVLAL